LVAERTSVAETCAPRRRAHDEALGSGNCARRRHHHREGATIKVRGDQHGLVAGKVRLRGQDVHRLRAGDARHELHRQRFVSGGGIGIHALTLAEGIKPGNDPRAGICADQQLRFRTLHAKHDIRALHCIVRNLGPGCTVLVVGDRGGNPRPGLDGHLSAEGNELFHGLWRCRNPALPCRPFPKDGDLHCPRHGAFTGSPG
jgi:hypothetical protein